MLQFQARHPSTCPLHPRCRDICSERLTAPSVPRQNRLPVPSACPSPLAAPCLNDKAETGVTHRIQGHQLLTEGPLRRGKCPGSKVIGSDASEIGLAEEGLEERQKGQAHRHLASSPTVLPTCPLLCLMFMEGSPLGRPHSAPELLAPALGCTLSTEQMETMGRSVTPSGL